MSEKHYQRLSSIPKQSRITFSTETGHYGLLLIPKYNPILYMLSSMQISFTPCRLAFSSYTLYLLWLPLQLLEAASSWSLLGFVVIPVNLIHFRVLKEPLIYEIWTWQMWGQEDLKSKWFQLWRENPNLMFVRAPLDFFWLHGTISPSIYTALTLLTAASSSQQDIG